MRLFREFENDAPTGAGAPGGDRSDEPRIHPASVKSIVALASARGGVGKSSLTVNLAVALALKGRKVGILDADLNSPCIATMLKMERIQAFAAEGIIEPAAGPLGLRLIGIDLLSGGDVFSAPVLGIETSAPIAREPVAPSESATLRRLLTETRFGALDLLLIDLPSGLDHFERMARLADLTGVLFVTQSTDLALRGVRKAIAVAAENSTPILGIIENMAGFYCGHCQSVRPLFPQGDTMGLRREFESSILGRLPFDPRLAESCDRGVAFVRQYAEAPLAKELVGLAERLEHALASRAQGARTSTLP